VVRHLYVHIPFCPKVCPYCSFYKEASDRNKTKAFLDAVLAEAEIEAEGLAPWTIFFGGGTPSALSTSQLQYLIGGLRERVDFSEVREFTLEMNPATVSLEKAKALLALGVNRVSMGVQSWDEELLKTLGRVHSGTQARRSYEILREAGVPNVNLDLIFGIPGQDRGQWIESLRQTVALDPDHISAYCLTYEEDTEYFERFRRGELVVEQGRKSNALFILLNGRARVLTSDSRGREVILAVLESGDYVGEMSLIDNEPHSATVRAEIQTDMLVLARADFARCLPENSTLSYGVMRGLVKRLRNADRQIESLALLDVYGRVARTLLDMAEEIDGVKIIRHKVSRQDMAKVVGASREMVSRVMKDLEDRGVIETQESGSVIIKERLQQND